MPTPLGLVSIGLYAAGITCGIAAVAAGILLVADRFVEYEPIAGPDSIDDAAAEREGDGTRRFSHAVVGHRGEDVVVEVTDDRRCARFLVRELPSGEPEVAPAGSPDRRYDEEWIAAAEEHLRSVAPLAETDPAVE